MNETVLTETISYMEKTEEGAGQMPLFLVSACLLAGILIAIIIATVRRRKN